MMLSDNSLDHTRNENDKVKGVDEINASFPIGGNNDYPTTHTDFDVPYNDSVNVAQEILDVLSKEELDYNMKLKTLKYFEADFRKKNPRASNRVVGRAIEKERKKINFNYKG